MTNEFVLSSFNLDFSFEKQAGVLEKFEEVT